MLQEEILAIFPERLKKILSVTGNDWGKLQEIRIRCGKSLILVSEGKKMAPAQDNKVITPEEFREILNYISNYSLYAFEEEIKKGYLTIPGGHRVGLAGKTVMENDRVKTIRSPAFMNVRVSHEIKGCSDRILPHLFQGDGFLSTLIVSPPGAGKTTLLRDIVRNLANGSGTFSPKTVSVIDERSEIAGCYHGIPQKDVGQHTDVLDGCSKQEGIPIMLRSMAPEVIAVDEIGAEKDYDALNMALTSGCGLVATVHGSSVKHLREKNTMNRILQEKMFQRILLLQPGTPGRIQKICDSEGRVMAL